MKHFTISENGTHLGVIPFGERAESPVDLSKNGMNLSKITDSLQELEHTWKDPFARTFTHLGLRKTVHMFKRSKRSVPKLFIIVTDGRSSLPRKLHGPLKKLKKMNVITFSIGVWGYDSKELLLMANNKVDRVFEIDNFPSLVNVIVKITQVICNSKYYMIDGTFFHCFLQAALLLFCSSIYLPITFKTFCLAPLPK